MEMTIQMPYTVNKGKQLMVENEGRQYLCFALRTKLVGAEDMLEDVVRDYVAPYAGTGDIVFLSEKMVACTQGRALPLTDIHPGFFARLLSRFVTRTPGGIGLGMPESMQCAIDECGLPRILVASAVGAFGKLLGRKGWFYHVAGRRAAAIDGPCHWTIPPYNQCVVLAPLKPEAVAKQVAAQLGGCLVLVVDVNDFGCEILGASAPLQDREGMLHMLRQNPLGQSDECTPAGILRPMGQGGLIP